MMEPILTQYDVPLHLSREAMILAVECLYERDNIPSPAWSPQASIEIETFINALLNSIERASPDNSDLI